MRPKSLMLLAMALGCGLIAAIGINQIMARPSNEVETTSIVVAKREILKGDLIKPDDIRLQEWRKDAMPEGAIEKIEDLQDKRVRSSIIPGEPLLMGKLLDDKGGNIEIPAGMKAVTVKVDNVSGLGGLVKPGDNVDVLVHVVADQQRGIMATTTKRFLENVKVLAVDDVTERPTAGEPSIAAKTVSLLVSPKDAMRTTLASEIGTIRLLMRSAKDQGDSGEQGVGDGGVGIADVLGGQSGSGTAAAAGAGGSALPPGITPLPPVAEGDGVGEALNKGFTSLGDLLKEMQNARVNGPPPEKKTWKVLLIEGPEAKEVEFSAGSRIARTVGGLESAPPAAAPAAPIPAAPPVSLGLPPEDPIDRQPDVVN
ncbi:MAG: Flp pilus assembly protein CpaB [Planctomycetia bacterium]|nr:Flp pilus assembly protein CpaB [Planctomycetia bacterium]